MVGHTGMAEGGVVAEVNRCIVDPGQACACKVAILDEQVDDWAERAAIGAAANAGHPTFSEQPR